LTVIKGNVGLMRKIKDFDEESLVTIEMKWTGWRAWW
jgi:hypothetical protein